MKAALAADPLAPFATKDQRACLGTDGTELNNYNWKVSWVPVRNNKFSFQNTWGEKFKNARDASDTRPIPDHLPSGGGAEPVRTIWMAHRPQPDLEGRAISTSSAIAG